MGSVKIASVDTDIPIDIYSKHSSNPSSMQQITDDSSGDHGLVLMPHQSPCIYIFLRILHSRST